MVTKRSRSMRKVPASIQARLSSVGNDFYVAVVKRISNADIQDGQYKNVGLAWENGQLAVKSPAPPSVESGRYARFNQDGQTIVRHDLPKVEKKITFINPRLFGIAGNRCQITQHRYVFQREQLPGRLLSIETAILLAGEDSCITRFNIKQSFSVSDLNFDRELLFALNLLQESVGGVNLFPSNATTQDYLGSIHVHWEILPAGERESNIHLILSSFRPRTKEEQEDLEKRANERYDFFETLGPKHIIRGTGGLNGYMGAVIEDDIVVFEHLSPGNGIYLLFADWATQSQRTKTDLLTNGQEGKDYIRVTHIGDWQLRVRNAIAMRIQ
jgi:hypothetical protein